MLRMRPRIAYLVVAALVLAGTAPTQIPAFRSWIVDQLGNLTTVAPRVGIGPFAPDYSFDVMGPANGTVARFRNSTNTEAIQLGSTGPGVNEVFIGTGINDDLILMMGTGGGNAERVRIKAITGNVGIGVADPDRILEVAPTISGQHPLATMWEETSSIRLKKDVRTLPDALDRLLRLRGVSFTWKESGQPDIGFIAEEVGEVVPEVVSYEANGKDAVGMAYSHVMALVVEAVKAQQAQLAGQRSEIDELRREIDEFKRERGR